MNRLAAGIRLGLGLGLLLAVLSLVGALPATANPSGTGLVISQAYGSGSRRFHGGAANASPRPQTALAGPSTPPAPGCSLAGWSVQYTCAPGRGNFGGAATRITPLSGSIEGGQYLLVQEASQAAVGA